MGKWTQKGRILAVEDDCPLGPDVLLLTKLAGVEGLSRPFNLDLTMVSENHSISFEAIVGKKLSVSIRLADGSKRYFNGYVASFSQGRGGTGTTGGEPVFSFYRATVVPGFWLHTRVANMRVFQKQPVPDIVKQILGEKGFQAFDERLEETYEKREYCLQYRETDFNFISRLLEEEGIYYFFEHSKGSHKMVLADKPGKHQPCPSQATAKYQISAGGWQDEDKITAFEKRKEIRVGKYTLNDYDFRRPNASLKVEKPTKEKLDPDPDKREVYDFAGRYVQADPRGNTLTNIRMEEEEAQITTISGSSMCRAFASGYRFTLLEHYRDDMNYKDYVLTEIVHEAEQVSEYTEKSDTGEDAESAYVNQFTCIPYEVPFRPRRVTPKPIVHGSETAIVVGPKSMKSYTDPDEIHPEHYGMVKIQFHWDREGQKNENSSCWIRVAYPYAGEKHGAQFTPLIGDEVMVDFLQGDPDKPVVTGSLFKGQHQSLVEQKRMIKNEILTPYGHCLHFDDKGAHITLKTGGGEVINMAEGKEDKTNFGNNIKAYTATGHYLHLAQGKSLKGIKAATKNGHTILMQKDAGVSCIQIFTEKLHSMTFDDENRIINITDSTAALSIDMDSAKGQIRVNNAATGGGWILLECPNGKISHKGKQLEDFATETKDIKAKEITIEATTKMTLRCGASSIEILPGQIWISSPTVNINGTGSVSINGAMVRIN